MSLRARLVAALTALLAVGMLVYGVGTYRAFARAELDRLDDDLEAAVPLVTRELVGEARERGGPVAPGDGLGPGMGPGQGRGRSPVIVAPGTFGQLIGPGGAVLASVQVADSTARPDLTRLDLGGGDGLVTVPSEDGDGSWRVSTTELGGFTVVVAVPLSAISRALARLVLIEAVAGVALLALLAVGAWAILRSELRPLERMAETARSITAGSLDQRVDGPEARDTEVGQLAAALNGMLDDLERSFQEREATEAKLRRFLADASHELRTPLTSIQGFAELFRLGPESEHVDLPTIMRRIEEESGRMRRLVEDLLMLARLDETHPAERRPVDLAVLAADACSDAVAMEPGRPVRLDAPEPVPVVGDPAHLRQAVGNLVVNALTHTPPGAPVEVSAVARDGHARLTVRDHGPGLDPAALERVFDRFWQADPSRRGEGTGLGLSIVEAVAVEHGGHADVRNVDGGGAAFTIEIPLTAEDGAEHG